MKGVYLLVDVYSKYDRPFWYTWAMFCGFTYKVEKEKRGNLN